MAGRTRRFKLGGESKVFDLRGIAIGERGKQLMQLSADYARKRGARIRIVPIAKDNNLDGVPRYGAFVYLPKDYQMHNTRPIISRQKNGRYTVVGGEDILEPYLSDVVENAVAKAKRRANTGRTVGYYKNSNTPIHNPLPNLLMGDKRDKYREDVLILNDTIEPPTKKRNKYSANINFDYDSLEKEIGIRLYNAKKTPEISRIRRNIMGTTSFDLKGGKMRKAQDFIIYPKPKNDTYPPYIFQIQSDTRIGLIDMRNGRIIATPPQQNGAYGIHLAFYINNKGMQSLGTLEESDYKALFDAIGASSQDWETEPSLIKSDNTGAGQDFFNSVKGREYERRKLPPKIKTKRLANPKGQLRKGDYEIYFGKEKVGELFRTGFGGEIEWTLKDFNGEDGIETTGHSTKRNAIAQMRFVYGGR